MCTQGLRPRRLALSMFLGRRDPARPMGGPRTVRSLLLVVPMAAACLLGTAHSARAGTAMSFSSWTYYGNNGAFSIGENFTVDRAIEITALGYLNTGNGLHQVGIYNMDQNLLVSTTVDPTTDPLENFFNYQTLATPYYLPAGEYVLASTNGSEAYTYSAYVTNFQMAPGFDFFNDRFSYGESLQFPTEYNNNNPFAWFGANFQFTDASSVPEPSSLILLGLGAAALAACEVRRRRRAARAAAAL